jgi:thiol:disulfide interchange protein DsbA
MLMLLLSMAVGVQAQEAYKEGVHYEALKTPVQTQDPTKIEVTEVFWYGCGHCFAFEPMIQQWGKTLQDDVKFVHSPAIWNGPMEVHARAYYVAKALNILDDVHEPIFNALNIEGKRLANEKSLGAFFSDFGVDADTFKKTYNSFGIVSQVKQANARARAYGIQGTPEIIVDGKYRVSSSLAGSQEGMLKVTDFLVEKIRKEKG